MAARQRTEGFVLISTLLVGLGLSPLCEAKLQTLPHGKASARGQNLASKYNPGKYGSLALYATALLNRDGTTTLLVSTVDGTTPPQSSDSNSFSEWPSLKKVQLKGYDLKGKLLFTQNDNSPGSIRKIYTLSGLAHGATIAVQANLDKVVNFSTQPITILPKTFVTNTTAVVKNRPNLAVMGIQLPSGNLVGISGTAMMLVQETGGDYPLDGYCQLSSTVRLTDFAAVSSTPVYFALAPGETGLCFVDLNFGAAGTFPVTAAITPHTPDQPTILVDSYAGDDSRNAPITIVNGTGNLNGKSGFDLVFALFQYSNFFDSSNVVSTLNANFPYFYEVQNDASQSYDSNVYFTDDVEGYTIGRWIPYPVTISYSEQLPDGTNPVASSVQIAAPDSDTTYVDDSFGDLSGVPNGLVHEQKTFLYEPVNGGLFVLHNQTAYDAGGNLVRNFGLVAGGRNPNVSVSFYSDSGTEQDTPDGPFNPYSYSYDSSYSSELGAGEPPASLAGYQLALAVTDGNGQQYAADVSVGVIGNASSSYAYSSCSTYSFSDDTGSYSSSSCGDFAGANTYLYGSFGQ